MMSLLERLWVPVYKRVPEPMFAMQMFPQGRVNCLHHSHGWGGECPGAGSPWSPALLSGAMQNSSAGAALTVSPGFVHYCDKIR